MDQLEPTATNGKSNGQATLTSQEIARQARLRYVCDSEPGLRRRRCGRGFLFFSASGKRLNEPRDLERINALAIPPAWTEVWICRYAKGHLQATGRDSRGRKQYRYHDRWQEMTGRAKFSTLLAFGELLPRIRRRVEKDMNQEGLTWTKVAALAVALLDQTGIRVGNHEYAADNQSYGLTTITNRHVQVTESQVVLSFNGKGGLKHRIVVEDPDLIKRIAQCRSIPGGTLLQYQNERGPTSLTSYDVNEYLSSFSPDITAKMFRTWHGSRLAADFLFHAKSKGSVSARKRLVSQAIREAAEHLGNTTTVCRKYYIHPQVIDSFLSGKFPEIFEGFSLQRRKRVTPAEQVLLQILNDQAA